MRKYKKVKITKERTLPKPIRKKVNSEVARKVSVTALEMKKKKRYY